METIYLKSSATYLNTFEKFDNFDQLDKKDLFERIRDKHRVNTQQIRQVILKMKKQYNRTKQRVINEQYKY